MLPQIMPLSWMMVLIITFFSFYSLLIFFSILEPSYKTDMKTVNYSFNKIIW